MNRTTLALLVLVMVLFPAGAIDAEEFIPLGPRSTAMGGMGVSSTRGADALYWNPALLPRAAESDDEDAPTIERTGWNFYVPVSLNVSIQGDLFQSVDDVMNIVQGKDATGKTAFDNIEAAFSDPTSVTTAQMTSAVGDAFKVINQVLEADKPGQGAYVTAGAAAQLRVGGFGIGVHRFAWAAIDPVLDLSLSGIGSIAQGGLSQVFTASGLQEQPAAPTNTTYSNFASQLDQIPGVTTGQANTFAQIAQDNNINVADPAVQDAINNIVTATAASTGAPAGATATSGTFIENQSGADLRMLTVTEVALGYGHNFVAADRIDLSLGGALKVMQGSTFTRRYAISDFEKFESEDLTDDLQEELTGTGDEKTTTFGLDLGAAVDLWDFFRVGLAAKNINRPTFDFSKLQKTETGKIVGLTQTGSKVELPLELRFGANLHVWKDVFVLGFEYDVTKNKSDLLPGYESQFAGAGIDFTPVAIGWFGLSIRAGIRDNLAESTDKPTYSVGLGLQIFFLQIEVGAAYSPSEVSIESSSFGSSGDKKIPQRIGAGVSIGLNTSF